MNQLLWEGVGGTETKGARAGVWVTTGKLDQGVTVLLNPPPPRLRVWAGDWVLVRKVSDGVEDKGVGLGALSKLVWRTKLDQKRAVLDPTSTSPSDGGQRSNPSCTGKVWVGQKQRMLGLGFVSQRGRSRGKNH
jgi:hypothetical protein